MLLAAILLLGACAKPSKEASYKGTLVMHVTPGAAGYAVEGKPGADWFLERARAFEALHKEITVRVEVHPSTSALEGAVLTAEADLAWGRPLLHPAERLVDLNPRIGAEVERDLLPGAKEPYLVGSRLLGLPSLVEVPVLALNVDAFEAAGVPLPPEGKWSRSEFHEALRRLSAGGRHALGFPYQPGQYEWLALAGHMFSPRGVLLPGAELYLGQLQEYRRQGWLHPDTAKLGPHETWSLFASRPAAFAVMPVGTWAIPLLRAEPYNVNLAVAGFPDGLTLGRVYGFTVFDGKGDGAREKAAIDLALFMAAPDQQVRLARETGLMPARRSAANPFDGDPVLVKVAALANSGDLYALPAAPAWDKAGPRFARELRLVLLGALSPAEALKSATAPAEK